MAVSLRINTENSNLQMKSVSPKMKIEGQSGDFSIDKTKGSMKIRQKADTLEIDTYNAYKQLGLKSPQDLMKSQGAKSKKKSAENLSSYVRDGEALMKIENKGNAIARISEKNANKANEVDLNIAYFPEEPIEIKVKKGYLKIDAQPEKIEVKSNNKLKISVEPGGIYTKVDQYPKVNIKAVGEIYDSKA
jgi:hypothetical protein